MSTISRTMNKSMDRSITDSSHVITERDVNSEVIVAGSHHGVLKFVGTVNKKEGLFCGVELEEPFGKHDGTFEGIQYFVGKANHCIFAPLYKVLLTKSENPLETTDIRDMSYKKINRPNSLLSRSAIPNLATSGYYKPRYSKEYNHKLMNNTRSDDFPNDLMDISTDSIMSNSKIFNNTDITNSDYMANSFSTYTISRKPKTNFGGLDDSQISNNRYNSLNLMETSTDFYPHNGTSLVSTARTEDVNFNYGSGELNYTTDTEEDMSASRILDHPTLDPNLLPTVYGKRQMVNYMIIQGNETTYDSFDDDSETPPDIETPHADNVNRAICQTFVEDSDEEIDLERTRRICEEEQDDEDGFNLCSESSRESSFGGTNTIRSTEDVRGNIQSCTTSNGDVSKSVDGKNDNGSTTPNMTSSRPSVEQLKNASARLLKATLQNNPPVESKSAEARRLKAEKAAAEAKAKGKSTNNIATATRVQKKDRVSVLESAKASDVPKIIRPPKPKSKHQILMDQIKASLEAEKNRPKKVVTSTIKVQLSENKTGSRKGSTEDMNKPLNVVSKNIAPISKRVPLRTTTDVNGKSVPPSNVKKLPISKKIEATASARTTKVEKPVNAVIPTRTTMSSRINRPTSSFAPAIAHSRKGSQASGALSTTSTLSRKLDLNKAKQGDHAKTATSADKEMMLKRNADAALVMAIALNNINCQLAAANARHAREISIKKQWQDNWETKISNLNDELIKVTTRFNHNLETEKTKNHEELEKARHEFNEQLDTAHTQYQSKISDLDGRLGEFEKQNEQLQKEKRDLQATLAKSNDEKIKTLYAEISSLNHAFDMRTEEAKNLRRQNEKLILENDTIAGKDIKIRKLTVKLADLSSQFELQKSTQKALAKKVEEAHQEANLNKSFNDSLSKENDFLKYRCEELTQSVYASELEHSDSSSGTMSQSVKLRSSFTTPRKDEQSPRPVSCSTTKRFNGYPMEASQSSRASSDVMQTSIISIYQDSYRKRNSGLKNRNADIIYGPDGAFVGGEESFGDEEF